MNGYFKLIPNKFIFVVLVFKDWNALIHAFQRNGIWIVQNNVIAQMEIHAIQKPENARMQNAIPDGPVCQFVMRILMNVQLIQIYVHPNNLIVLILLEHIYVFVLSMIMQRILVWVMLIMDIPKLVALQPLPYQLWL